MRDIFLEGPTQVLKDVLRLQEGARCQVARDGVLRDS